jgi:hypothetical protein
MSKSRGASTNLLWAAISKQEGGEHRHVVKEALRGLVRKYLKEFGMLDDDRPTSGVPCVIETSLVFFSCSDEDDPAQSLVDVISDHAEGVARMGHRINEEDTIEVVLERQGTNMGVKFRILPRPED